MNAREEAGVPESAAFIDIDGTRLAVSRSGKGPAVICLHAIAHGGRDFETFAKLVGDRFEVIRIDWPGQGRSSPDSQPASAARYAELLARVLTALGVERPILLGNSVGGAAALIHAAQPDANVRAVVACDPGGLIEIDDRARKAIALMARFFAAGERGAGWFGIAFRAYYRFLVLPKRAAKAQRRRIVAAGYENARVLREAWESFAAPEADIRALAATLKMPVWFAWARSDRIVSLKQSRPAIDAMKDAHVTTFGGGHAPFLEQPKAFAKAFIKFANSLPA
jgi:4,5:9,10-diseco-3-hydroxy-5,9,17-trioxoandrosta-1(10),2-diene-4-oate hydrolase